MEKPGCGWMPMAGSSWTSEPTKQRRKLLGRSSLRRLRAPREICGSTRLRNLKKVLRGLAGSPLSGRPCRRRYLPPEFPPLEKGEAARLRTAGSRVDERLQAVPAGWTDQGGFAFASAWRTGNSNSKSPLPPFQRGNTGVAWDQLESICDSGVLPRAINPDAAQAPGWRWCRRSRNCSTSPCRPAPHGFRAGSGNLPHADRAR